MITSPESIFDRLAGKTLMAVYSHPDDETYLSGGLMAAFTRNGGRVVHVTATMGELGSPDPEAFSEPEVAALRATELANALAELGVTESVSLGYRDGDCEAADEKHAAQQVRELIGRFDPDLIVSFGPDGITGHPDHITTGKWVRRAVETTGKSVPLLASFAADVWPVDLEQRMHDAGAFMPGYRKPATNGRIVQLDLDTDLLHRKLSALSKHASQTAGLVDYLGETDYRRMAAIEAFVPANDAAIHLVESLQLAHVA